MAQSGRYALITGSSRGIGRGIALKLAGQGVRVAINYCKNETAAKDTLAKLKQRGSDGFVVQADVCRPDDIARMFARVKAEFGKLDIFVSNARPDVPEFYQGPMNITLEQWDAAMNSQAKAFLVAVRAACPLMGEGGRIVAITYAPGGRTGSWQAWVGMGAAKSAMETLCRYFAVALAKRGITVNAIFDPPGADGVHGDAALRERHGEVAAQRFHGALGGAHAYPGLPTAGAPARRIRDRDDPAALAHQRARRAHGHQEGLGL